MSRSNDPGHYFQTTSALNESARKATKSKNTKGKPIKLPSKLLALSPDPHDDNHIYVAEAAGNVKRIHLETGEVSATFAGPAAPLTSVTISPKSGTVFAGCWDKSIWSWDIASGKSAKRFLGHGDFVKAVLVFSIQDTEVLVSASADASIIVWDVASGKKLHTLKGHTRGVLALALEPVEYDAKKGSATVFSAGSDREIRKWSISVDSASEIQPSPIIVHQTSIDALYFDSDGDLWSASADKTAKCLARGRDWETDATFEHADFVRDITIDEEGGWAVTACRDEEVRVWEKGSGKLHHTYSGHFEEVTGLLLLPGQRLVSISIDATVRQWSLRGQDLVDAIKEAEDEKLGKKEEKAPIKGSMMTVEEEAELAELLEDSE